jgi:hypothetical protein
MSTIIGGFFGFIFVFGEKMDFLKQSRANNE